MNSDTKRRLDRIEAKLDEALARLSAIRTTSGVEEVVALKRAQAAKAMGISPTKLDGLIKAGKVKTAEDEHLVPMSEVRRYCAPKSKRQRRPSVGVRAMRRHVDTQSDAAIEQYRRSLRKARR